MTRTFYMGSQIVLRRLWWVWQITSGIPHLFHGTEGEGLNIRYVYPSINYAHFTDEATETPKC